ncbi:septum formation protein Maf [Alphaproteobacteria bacterium GH1-50]|uniref:dTTP/UTP pyrophosphatase n=1 Tax=Kangsaoukella pontilimi TaxID=2691042 RepID=A0A7C9ISJ3_9RHOB|nr:Maf family protein [Kangsaoukella pontilimi]MXQ08025.1 septum formation protein Maf [Kangsaoukella pontilimi]
MRLVLGSGSPRRRELLASLGIVPDDVRAPDVDETPLARELPRDYCRRVTAAKIDAIPCEPDEVVLAADTTVALGRRIMGKPADADEARAFLELLSGRRHRVITAVAVKSVRGQWQRDVVSAVRMKRLNRDEIDGYIATGDWTGKAGAYAIQGPAAAFVPWISGSHSAIVGLPLAETATLLRAAGYDWSGETA